MAKEEELSVDEVCHRLILELAAEEGDETALAQVEFWGGFDKIKKALERAARAAAEAARRAAETAAALAKIVERYGPDLIKAAEALGKDLTKLSFGAVENFAKWFEQMKKECRKNPHLRIARP